MEFIINTEFFEEKSSFMKHVYLVHSLSGGIFYEDYVISPIKYLARILASFAYLTNTAALVMQLCQPGTTFQVVQSALIMFILFQMWIALAVFVYLKRDTFHTLFEHMNEYLNQPVSQHIRERFQQNRMKNCNLILGKYFIAWNLIIYLSMLCQKFADGDEEFHIDYEFDFITPFPFTNSQSFIGYILIYHWTFVIFLFHGYIGYGLQVLSIMLSDHLENQMARLLNDIDHHTESTFECMEECFRREEQLLMESTGNEDLRRVLLKDIAKRRERHEEEFTLKMNQWIEMHQNWILCVNFLKKCTVGILTTNTALHFVAITGNIYSLSKMILDSQEIGYQYIFYIFIDIVFFLMTCTVGDSLDEMNDTLSAAIYSTPWYYLSAKNQKVVLNFLCMAQNGPKICMFDVFPLSLELLPKLLNDAYSNAQLMRILEFKNKH